MKNGAAKTGQSTDEIDKVKPKLVTISNRWSSLSEENNITEEPSRKPRVVDLSARLEKNAVKKPADGWAPNLDFMLARQDDDALGTAN